MYVKISNGMVSQFPYTLGNLKQDNPQVSFPVNISNELLATYDVFPVKELPAPTFDNLTHRLSQSIVNIDNEWCQLWESRELKISLASNNIRAKRDRLLSNTDWVVTNNLEIGNPIPQEWLYYRQSLRDVTEQSGFPYNVTWPIEPN
jgi:hypothetical protein